MFGWLPWKPAIYFYTGTNLFDHNNSFHTAHTILYQKKQVVSCYTSGNTPWPQHYQGDHFICFRVSPLGGLSVLWALLWTLLIHDTPAVHPRITPGERTYIEKATEGLDTVKVGQMNSCPFLRKQCLNTLSIFLVHPDASP